MMKLLTLTNSDSGGGAARAAVRLHEGLKQSAVDATMLVRQKRGQDPGILTLRDVGGRVSELCSQIGYLVDRRPLVLYRSLQHEHYFSINWFPTGIADLVRALNPDIVHMHWIGQDFVPVGALARFDRPVVWTLHDQWAFTGGCYWTYDCRGYKDHCGRCPQLGSSAQHDISSWNLRRKHDLWRAVNLTIVTPSQWLADCVRESTLFAQARVEVIPNSLNLEQYKPFDKRVARSRLNLPQDRLLILFGAVSSTSAYAKGFHLLQPALRKLAEQSWSSRADVVIFGNNADDEKPALGMNAHYMNYVDDENQMALLYAAADVFVIPSVQENFPYVVMESMACATPCVGFQIGGIPDLIEQQVNGYLAKPYEIEDLARGIAWVLEDDERRHALATRAVAKVRQNYALQDIAQRHARLYENILAQGSA